MERRRHGPAKGIVPQDLETVARDPFSDPPNTPDHTIAKPNFRLTLT